MQCHALIRIETVIDYIENHLDGKLDLETIACAVHASKYHLHRQFTAAAGMTIHDYIQRRQLTEAAKLLIFSDKPVMDIALICGYESQQAFTAAFKAMYKLPPAQYRESGVFYPLQLRFVFSPDAPQPARTADAITLAQRTDLPDWMNLMRLCIDGYPVMNESDYLQAITTRIDEKRALILRDNHLLIGAMAFSVTPCCIDFLGVHPQYKQKGIQKLFLDALMTQYLPGQEISMTTYREGDKADTGHRALLIQLGFAERELLTEFGYPTQRFALSPCQREEAHP